MIGIEAVEKIARLARLEIEEKDKQPYQKELSSILSFVEKIQELDLSNVAPTNHILDLQNVTRPDQVQDSADRKKILENAPSEKDGFIVVPKVI
jgi:aspartyl-tRNA(Asn)/glutamyl-tRNA(Gln) amidotransferase subunit C